MSFALPWKRIAVGLLLAAEIGVLSYVAWSASMGPMFGVAVPAKDAAIQMSDQRNVVHTVKVDRVVAPADGWLIVQADWDDSVPDAILGSTWVPTGVSQDVQISLDPLSPVPKRIFVTLLADKGQPHVLEYAVAMRPGMERMRGMGSTTGTTGPNPTLDIPVIAGGQVVSAHVGVSALSFAVGGGQASISEATRTVEATSVAFARVVAPAQSWIAVSVPTASGTIGRVLGSKLVRAGETTGVVVPLASQPASQAVIATLHVDLGTVGQFDFNPTDIGNSYDQPYVAGGQTVMVRVPLVASARPTASRR